MTARTGNPVGRPPRLVSEGMRWCGGHQQEHPPDEFSGEERSCRLAKYQNHLLNTYGLSVREFDALRRPDGLCPICLLRPAKYVDHNHLTGVVRGVLCQPCNSALGAFAEDQQVFQRALDYLTRRLP